MTPHNDFPADLKPLEAALSGLAPSAPRVDRDRLMYLAGAAAHESATSGMISDGSLSRRLSKNRFIWPLSTAALLLVSAVLGALVAFRQPAERIVYVDRPAAKSQSPDAATVVATPSTVAPLRQPHDSASADYLVLRDLVLRNGVGALDRGHADGGDVGREETRNRALLRTLLGS